MDPLLDLFRLRGRRTTVHDLHGHLDPDGPCEPSPYTRSFGSARFVRELDRPVRQGATARWVHGQLVRAASEEVLADLTARWGPRRTAGATIGPLAVPETSANDRALVRSFCQQRGWQRPLVRFFAHVGCKAAHVGRLSPAGVAPFGDVGQAILGCARRPRLALLEELLRARAGDGLRLLGELDAMDRALDAAGLGTSWLMTRMPDHCRELWPLRNLMRLGDRVGMVIRPLSEVGLIAENSYVPELPILCVDPVIYGGGFMNHDIYHFLAPVVVGTQPRPFVLGNSCVEAEGQYYNNLIYLHRHSGPDYEGYGAWAEGRLFESLERSFGATSFPEAIAAGRLLPVVLQEGFEGPIQDILRELVPTLRDGCRVARGELLSYFVNHIRHDQDFLRGLWPRYTTPIFAEWRRHFGDRCVDDLGAMVQRSDDLLWDLEDIDLRTWDHPLRGRVGVALQTHRYLCFKLIELRHLLALSCASSLAHRSSADALMTRALDLHARWTTLQGEVVGAADHVPPAERDPGLLTSLDRRADAVAEACADWTKDLDRLSRAVRAAQSTWPDPIARVPRDFVTGYVELFQNFLDRGFYYQHPMHDPEDKVVRVTLDDGTTRLLPTSRAPLGRYIDYPDLPPAQRVTPAPSGASDHGAA